MSASSALAPRDSFEPSRHPGLEPVKDSLVQKLKELQGKTASLLPQVAQLRTMVLADAASSWQAQAATETPAALDASDMDSASADALAAADGALDLADATQSLDHALALLAELDRVRAHIGREMRRCGNERPITPPCAAMAESAVGGAWLTRPCRP